MKYIKKVLILFVLFISIVLVLSCSRGTGIEDVGSAMKSIAQGMCASIPNGSTVYILGIKPDSIFLSKECTALEMELESFLWGCSKGKFTVGSYTKRKENFQPGKSRQLVTVVGRLGRLSEIRKEEGKTYYLYIEAIALPNDNIVFSSYKRVKGVKETLSINTEYLKEWISKRLENLKQFMIKAGEKGQEEFENLKKKISDFMEKPAKEFGK